MRPLWELPFCDFWSDVGFLQVGPDFDILDESMSALKEGFDGEWAMNEDPRA